MSDSMVESAAEINFQDLNLSDELLRAISGSGYSTATPIQARAIPPLLSGRDVLGQAQTGTGKTAAFAIPMLERIDLARRDTQVLVLTPTRELAIQVAESFERYGKHLTGLRVAAIYGGQDYNVQFRQLDRGVHVVVGTPGRVMDHLRRNSLKLEQLGALVLDEADEMLNMGFAEDVEWILEQTPSDRQIALFSATMPDSIRRIAQQHLREPEEITIQRGTTTADTVRQRFLVVPNHHKPAALARLLEAEPVDGVLVFVKTKSTTAELSDYLAAEGYRTAALSSDVAQKQRERVVESLRAGRIDVIVATDVAARGLDVQRISHVINYDLPFDSESYVHRIGRTGRAGRDGNAILFIHPRDRHLLRRIEKATRQPIEQMELPGKRAINQRRVAKFHEKITAALANSGLSTFESLVQQYQAAHPESSLEKIAAALAVMAAGDTPLLLADDMKLPGFADTRGPNDRSRDGRESRDRRQDGDARGPSRGPRRRESGPMETFRLEVGNSHQVRPGNIVGAIANETGLDSSVIGRIEIFDAFSTIDMLAGMPDELFLALKQVRVGGRKLNISRLNESGANQQADGDKPARVKAKKPKREQAPA